MPKPFEPLRERLLRAGVAPHHVRRYILELSQHFEDLRTDLEQEGYARPKAEAVALNRIGRIDDLAQAMIDQPRLRSWNVRAPWATLVLGSCLAFAAGIMAALMLLASFGPSVPSSWAPQVASGTAFFCNFLLPLLCGWTVAVVAIRQRMDSFWPVVALGVLALVSSAIQVGVTMSGGHGEIGVGAGASLDTVVLLARNLVLTLIPYLIWRKWTETARGIMWADSSSRGG
ncbi:hypothetical protein ATN84_10400 [Paramesorhizobium deserti]|uniref:Uncharacterized protein n=1 Tax=Paramesorhizobium deserti TaxID=1494590 RepID=A0A135HX34_9HYPH|nr:hypothetical protein [Paramesorhizobium deserti]KXF77731.1 hypothetical protein ATN84_10400 [Paramesorhizobium deserti]